MILDAGKRDEEDGSVEQSMPLIEMRKGQLRERGCKFLRVKIRKL